MVELKRVMEYQPEDIDQGNKNRVTNYQLWKYVEEMWLPFSVWPPAQDLRQSVCVVSGRSLSLMDKMKRYLYCYLYEFINFGSSNTHSD